VRFEPGIERRVELAPLSGRRCPGRDSAARRGVASGTIFPAESDEWRGEYSYSIRRPMKFLTHQVANERISHPVSLMPV
jgi:hypothetical protein